MGGTVLADLEIVMARADLGSCSGADLAGLMRRALSARQVVSGFVNQLTAEARRREASGAGAPARELLRSGGQVSNRQARDLDRRAGIGEVLPTVGEDLDRGRSRDENADLVARQVERLADAQRRALGEHDAEIARQAASLPPEAFARWFGRLVRRITTEAEDAGSVLERQRAASEFG